MTDTKIDPSELIEQPPDRPLGILRRLGPGLIVAGSIVGSGELIATTRTGAEAGFWLLWLILIGCVIKVFVQVEFGRYAITCGERTMEMMNRVPGPRWRANWLVWYWFAMFLASLGQLGGIVGGVGQALAISVPLTEAGRNLNQQAGLETQYRIAAAEYQILLAKSQSDGDPSATPGDERIAGLRDQLDRMGPELLDLRLKLGRAERDRLRKGVMVAPAELARGDELTDIIDRLQVVRGQSDFDITTDALTLFDPKSPRFATESPEFQQQLPAFGRYKSNDDKRWAAVVAIATAIILVLGRYGLIQSFSTVMVASFTLITIVNLVALQTTGEWAVTTQDIINGMRFRLTPEDEALSASPLGTALKTFGIIGVGASELITYPYWCLEKGYARFTGPRDKSPDWAQRALGWMRVMRWDAMCSMVVYTFATIAFYLLGAAILGRIQLAPEGPEMIRTLAIMYEPVFGTWTQILFLFGAIAVLYSTFFVANASHARVFPDALRALKIGDTSETNYRRRVRVFSGVFPLVCLTLYILYPKPVTLVLLSGTMQALMLPMLSFAALFFRYKLRDERLQPGGAWDVCLWISAAGMLLAGGWLLYGEILKVISALG